MTKRKREPSGTPGSLPLKEYDPLPDWLREPMEGPMPRDKDGNPQMYNTDTGEWETVKPP